MFQESLRFCGGFHSYFGRSGIRVNDIFVHGRIRNKATAGLDRKKIE